MEVPGGGFTCYQSCIRSSLPSHQQKIEIGTGLRVGPATVAIVCKVLGDPDGEGWLKIRVLEENGETLEEPLVAVKRLCLTNEFRYLPATLKLPFVHVVHECVREGEHPCAPAPPRERGKARPRDYTSDPFRGHNRMQRCFLLNRFYLG